MVYPKTLIFLCKYLLSKYTKIIYTTVCNYNCIVQLHQFFLPILSRVLEDKNQAIFSETFYLMKIFYCTPFWGT